MGVKYRVNEEFFCVWSLEITYVLGFIYADGSLAFVPQIRGRYIEVTSTDEDRICLIKRLLASEHRVAKKVFTDNRKARYSLRIGSHALYSALIKKGVTPNKSFTMKFPDIPFEFLPSFILGYFDGDGCAHIERGKIENIRRMLTIFTSGSKDFLERLHSLLREHAGVVGNGLCKHGSTEGTYQLRYSTRDSIRIFMLMYHDAKSVELCMKRKYDIFIEYFRARRISVDDFPWILKQKGPVVNRKHDGLQNRYSAGSTPAWASRKPSGKIYSNAVSQSYGRGLRKNGAQTGLHSF